ncbi:hypothetical protein EF912_30065, partial [Streptomyces sp. WAC07061]
LPVWMAAYGPKALALTGQKADGIPQAHTGLPDLLAPSRTIRRRKPLTAGITCCPYGRYAALACGELQVLDRRFGSRTYGK